MTIQRGEIYFVNLNPVQGREQAGRISKTKMVEIEAIIRYCLGL
ncbi:PemK-like protein (fragment) [Planktothrix serta PCC 8927]|uniref:PemK-like protein n=1 Tax=Planktothrix serta PCC 8927 TaxID=671068 RepID=A0A7Z9BW06_9CYAN